MVIFTIALKFALQAPKLNGIIILYGFSSLVSG